jgi:hypothetical protein
MGTGGRGKRDKNRKSGRMDWDEIDFSGGIKDSRDTKDNKDMW